MCIDWANWQYVVTSWSRDTPEVRWYKAHYVCFQKINNPSKLPLVAGARKSTISWPEVTLKLAGSWPEVDRKLTGSWSEVAQKSIRSRPEVDRKSVGSWPEVGRKLPGSRSEVVRKLVGSRANHVTSLLHDTPDVRWYNAHHMCFRRINTPSQLPHVAGTRKWSVDHKLTRS